MTRPNASIRPTICGAPAPTVSWHTRMPPPTAQAKAEEPLGEDSKKDQPSGDDGLDDRKLHQRERADMQHPCPNRRQPSDRPPLSREQAADAAQRMPAVHRRRRDRAAVTEEKARVGHQRA